MPWYELPKNPNWKQPPNTHTDHDTLPEIKRQVRKQRGFELVVPINPDTKKSNPRPGNRGRSGKR